LRGSGFWVQRSGLSYIRFRVPRSTFGVVLHTVRVPRSTFRIVLHKVPGSSFSVQGCLNREDLSFESDSAVFHPKLIPKGTRRRLNL
jgi:hypothetical protein